MDALVHRRLPSGLVIGGHPLERQTLMHPGARYLILAFAMPQHDLPDGNETGSNLIDFREHLRRRASLPAKDNDDPKPEATAWEAYRHAEYGDGKRPRFSRYDALWIGLILSIGWIFWLFVFG